MEMGKLERMTGFLPTPRSKPSAPWFSLSSSSCVLSLECASSETVWESASSSRLPVHGTALPIDEFSYVQPPPLLDTTIPFFDLTEMQSHTRSGDPTLEISIFSWAGGM